MPHGGHARVLADILQSQADTEVVGYTDVRPAEKPGFPYLGNDSVIELYAKDDVLLVNGIGSTNIPIHRKELYSQFLDKG